MRQRHSERRDDHVRDAGHGISPGKTSLTASLGASDLPAPAWPGKRTLTEGLVVQRRGVGAASTDRPADVAANGVAAASDRLPHFDWIQASFGRHDVSHVRSQTGGSAGDAAGALGASAFAVGDRVGFAASPDLHTAAHEAAHVVQQRGGVQLRGGIDGGAGDRHEQHADAVADTVVRGESAEPLLDAFAGTGSPAAGVQRKPAPHGMVNARRYLSNNAYEARTAIGTHLASRGAPEPHARLSWRNERAFFEAFLFSFHAKYQKLDNPYELLQVLFPHDPYALIDEMRPLTKIVEDADGKDDMTGGRVGPWQWVPAIGLALAQLFEQVVTESVFRLGPRIVAYADGAGLDPGPLDISALSISRSHPMDRLVVPAMCKEGILELHAGSAKSKPSSKKPATKPGGKTLTLTWVGKDNKELWNWVRVSPPDATVEEVAAKIFEYMIVKDRDATPDYYAAFLTAAPPLYGIPPQWAKTFEETREFRPKAVASADVDPDHQLAVLGGSTAADQQALDEIDASPVHADPKAAPRPAGNHDNLIADASSQATVMQSKLAAWKLGDAADRTLAFIARRRHDGKDTAKWLPVLTAQRDNLSRIASGVMQVDAAVDQMKLAKTGPQVAALREVMRFYADATATSHLNRSCNHLILRAANAQSALTVQGLQASMRDMDTSVDAMRAGVKQGDYDRTQVSNRAASIDATAIEMRTRLIRGEKVKGEDIEDLQLSAEDTALESKFTAIDFALRELEHAADEAGVGLAAWFAGLFSSKFRGLKDATQKIRDRIHAIQAQWQTDKGYADMPGDDGSDHTKDNLRKAVRTARAAFVKLTSDVGDDTDIQTFLKEGSNVVKWQQFRTACVRVAALIGISLVGGVVGGMIARGAASMMVGTSGAVAMENLTLGGAMVARGAGLVAETAITSAGQSIIFDEKFGTSFIENMIMNLGSAGVLKVLGGKAEEVARLEKATEGFWKKGAAAGKFVIRETAAITGHAIMGMAMGYVAHKIVTGQGQPPPATLEEWLLQGAGIAVGRYVGKAMEASHARQQRLKLKGFGSATRLATETEKLTQLSRRVEEHPQAKDAMELLEKRHHHLTEEQKVLEEIERSPELMKQTGMSKAELSRAKAEIRHQLADVHAQGFGDVPLHLAGMTELIPGALWSGTPHEIEAAIHTAQESGIDLHARRDPQGGKWHLEVEGRKIVVEERFDPSGHSASTKTGTTPVGAAGGGGGARAPENVHAVTARAAERLNAMAAPERAQFEAVLKQAENPGQRTLLERTIAAGRSPHELDQLRAAMRGMGDAEVAKAFSGDGVVQFYEQGCVPAAYQVAIADIDPYYALELRNHPERVMQEQRDVLLAHGAAQEKRKDIAAGRPAKAMQPHLEDAGMRGRIDDNANYSDRGDKGGIEATQMTGTALHKMLERATGAPYEVLTSERKQFTTPGQGEFAHGNLPYARIRAALAAGRPVLIATERLGRHAQIIVPPPIVGADGHVSYTIHEPMSGTVSVLPEQALDWMGTFSLTLPKGGGEAPIRTPTGRPRDPNTKAGTAIPPHQTELGTDPKRGYIEHEGEAGILLETHVGTLKRDASGAGEWVGTQGAYAGKVFDLLGLPAKAVAHHADDMAGFLPSIDHHFVKSIDFVVLDTRYMRPAQRAAVDKHIDAKWKSHKGRLIIL